MTTFDADRVRRKLAILADAAKYDASCASGTSRAAPGKLDAPDTSGICHSYTPDGRCVSLLKVLLTNSCVYDCVFCVNRVSNDVPRARFSPDEVATLTIELHRRNFIEGLFLSSGVVVSPDHTAEQMAEVGRLLREVHGFRGFVHFKVVPGTSPELVARLGRWADRLSANVELPTQADLDRLAPDKSIAETSDTMGAIRDAITVAHDDRTSLVRGQTTQLVVGATASPDAVVLATADTLYRHHGLKRVYYTAFSPFPGADPRLPPVRPPLAREHRLYQADWLLRHYGFALDELLPSGTPDLDLALDPKHAWALRNRGVFPVDVNRADRALLLRIPGVGVRTADRIIAARRHRRLGLAELARLGATLRRAAPFVVTADANPALATLDREPLRAPEQLSLFGPTR